jgi:ABC-2 type transport system ATP-binding protein
MNIELPLETKPATDTTRPAISVYSVTKQFGKKAALNGLELSIPKGSVYAVLGRNGAGKSTLMQLLLGLLEPTSGTMSVLGLDPVKDCIELRRRVGYIPERLPMYEWMTIAEILRFVAAQYPVWSTTTEAELVAKFRLPIDQRIRTLSRGQRALLTLVLAMAHEPELVLLDECTSGMDALAREEFDRSVIDLLHDSGRTVVFASHQIAELDRLCDWVGIVHEGRLLLQMPVEDLKAQVKTLQVTGEVPTLPGLTILKRQALGRDTLLTVRGEPSEYKNLPTSVVDVISLRLEQIFVALVNYEENRS